MDGRSRSRASPGNHSGEGWRLAFLAVPVVCPIGWLVVEGDGHCRPARTGKSRTRKSWGWQLTDLLPRNGEFVGQAALGRENVGTTQGQVEGDPAGYEHRSRYAGEPPPEARRARGAAIGITAAADDVAGLLVRHDANVPARC